MIPLRLLIASVFLLGSLLKSGVAEAVKHNCCDNLELVGTIVDEPEKKSWAVVENLKDHRQGIYLINNIIPGGAKIVKISAQSILLEQNGAYHKLKLRRSLNKSGHPSGSETGYKKLSANAWEIEADKVVPDLWDVVSLANEIQLANFHCPDGARGVRIDELPDDHFLRKVGFEQGDIVEEVNGAPVNNISELISAIWKSDDSSRIAVKAGCQGDQRNLTYHYGNSNKTPNYSSKQIKQAVNAGGSTGVTANVSW